MRLLTAFSILTALAFTAHAEGQPQTPAATKTMTMTEWTKLSNDDKEAFIEGVDLELYSNLKQIEVQEENAITKVADASAKIYAEKMDAFMQDNVNFEIEDEHSRVGDTTVYFLSVLTLDGVAVGGSIGYFQDGCDLENENYQHYDTEQEAKAAGCDVDADVSWQASGVFDENVKAIRHDDYMEWSGY